MKQIEIIELLPPGSWQQIRKAFSNMAIVEDEIATYKVKYPEKVTHLHRAFLACGDVDSAMYALCDSVFLSHVREILERVATGKDLRPGTRAELLTLLHSFSLKTPLTADSFLLYKRLFEATVGPLDAGDYNPGESYAGAIDELERIMVKKLTKKERKLT